MHVGTALSDTQVVAKEATTTPFSSKANTLSHSNSVEWTKVPRISLVPVIMLTLDVWPLHCGPLDRIQDTLLLILQVANQSCLQVLGAYTLDSWLLY